MHERDDRFWQNRALRFLYASLSQLADYAVYLRLDPGVENCFLRHAAQLPCYLGSQI